MKRSVHSKKNSSFSPAYLSVICMQIYTLQQSGISLDDGIEILLTDSSSDRERAMFKSVLNGLDSGFPFSKSIENAGFPEYMVHMSEMGERTGNLEKVMLSLSKYYNRQSIIDENIKNAVLYPLMMAVLMAVILGIIITKVLPVFSGIFSQLGLTLSPAAEFLLKAGKILPSAAAVILVLAIILSIAAYLLYKSGRLNILSRTKISCLIAESRFSSSMALMISSGMDMDDALEMASKLVSHPYVSPKIARLQDLIFDGEMFEDALEKAGLFTDYYRRMLRIGSKSGKLDIMMNETADRMNSNISNRIDSIISGIEPAAVITLSVLAGLILLSVMLPLLSILSSIG